MQASQTMGLPIQRSVRTDVCLLVLAGLFFWESRVEVLAADKIELPSKTGRLDMSEPGKALSPGGQNFDFLRSTSPSGGVVEPLPMPSSASPGNLSSKRMLEYLDQRRNWMFSSPSLLNARPSLDDLFRVQTKPQAGDIFGESAKPKKAMEQFLEDGREKSEKKTGANQDKDAQTDSPEVRPTLGMQPIKPGHGSSTKADPAALTEGLSIGRSGTLVGTQGTEGLTLNGSTPEGGKGTGLLGTPGGQTPLSVSGAGLTGTVSALESSVSASNPLRYQQQQREERTKRLLDSGGPGSPDPLDPSMMRSDSTSSAANPVLPVTGASLASGAGKGLPSITGKNGLPVPTGGLPRTGALEGLAAQAGGGSSLAPVLATPSAPSYAVPKPGVLQFPRRGL